MDFEEMKRLLNEWLTFSEKITSSSLAGESVLHLLRVNTMDLLITLDELPSE